MCSKSRIKRSIQLIFLCLLMGCTSENAEDLYPTNDEVAQAFYENTLKSIIEEKCISCHIYHLEGTNRYDTYDKTKAAIGIMLERIRKNDNTVMPPPDSKALTQDEKEAFAKFIDLLNTTTEEKEQQVVAIEWTAYKYPIFEQRVGVSGSFKKISYELNDNFENPLDILDTAKVVITTESVNVGDNPERASNVGQFFKNFTPTIAVNIISYTDSQAIISITMNQITQEVLLDLQYSEAEKKIELSGKIPDLSLFNWENGYNALEEVCGVYHQNKVWPDVDIKAVINIK